MKTWQCIAANLAFLIVGLCVPQIVGGELPMAEMQYPNVVAPVHQFGTFGNAPGEFNNMGGLAALENGNLLIADTYNFRIQEVALDGTPLKSWEIQGPHGLIAPVDVEPRPGGGFATIDARSNAILFVSRAGSVERIIEGGNGVSFQSPTALRIRSNALYVADTGNARIVKFDLANELDDGPSLVFGEFGDGDGQFKRPSDVAVSEDGSIFVADSDNDRIQKFDEHGTLISAWGEWGSYSGMLATPIGLDVHSDEVYVADLVNHRIQVFDTSGAFLFQFGRHPPQSHEGNGRVHYPTMVSVTPDGRYTVVCEPFEHRCQVFDEMNLGTVAAVDDSAWWDKATRFHYGTSVVTNGAFMVITEPDTHAALLFDIREDPRFLTTFGGRGTLPGQFIRPSGALIDPDGQKLFVSDAGNRRIQQFAIDQVEALNQGGSDGLRFETIVDLNSEEIQGAIQTQSEVMGLDVAAGGLSEPSGMRIGPDGNIWVIDPDNSRMMILDPETYQLIRFWGEKGAEPGQLSNPLKFTFSQNGQVVYVADHYNYRVQAFNIEGEYLFDFGGPESVSGRLFVLPFDISGGVDGYLYVTDVGSHNVLKFSEDGTLVSKWGSWGDEPGQFYKPKGIAQSTDGRVFVVDFGNHRAQYFTPEGDFIGEFGIYEDMQGAMSVPRP